MYLYDQRVECSKGELQAIGSACGHFLSRILYQNRIIYKKVFTNYGFCSKINRNRLE